MVRDRVDTIAAIVKGVAQDAVRGTRRMMTSTVAGIRAHAPASLRPARRRARGDVVKGTATGVRSPTAAPVAASATPTDPAAAPAKKAAPTKKTTAKKATAKKTTARKATANKATGKKIGPKDAAPAKKVSKATKASPATNPGAKKVTAKKAAPPKTSPAETAPMSDPAPPPADLDVEAETAGTASERAPEGRQS